MQTIKASTTDKDLTSFGGLLNFDHLMTKIGLEEALSPILPSRNGWDKAKHFFHSFIAGAECLDDIDVFGRDAGLRRVLGGSTYHPKSLGNFLRAFSGEQLRRMNLALCRLAILLRGLLEKRPERIIIDIDSTTNSQHGSKMEGLGWNYNNRFGFDTIAAFDELGLLYWLDVRPGGTDTAKDCELIIHAVAKRIRERWPDVKIIFRADAGYCQKSFIGACRARNVDFILRATANMFAPMVDRPTIKWRDAKDDVGFNDGRKTEMGATFHTYKEFSGINTMILMRALKSETNHLIASSENYDHYGFITSLGDVFGTWESRIILYRDRGHAENYIKDLKYSLDLLHYPCLKLSANKAYGLFAGISYNLMRFAGIKLARRKNGKIPYIKKVRTLLVNIPAVVVSHARRVCFKFMRTHAREVAYWNENLHIAQLDQSKTFPDGG